MDEIQSQKAISRLENLLKLVRFQNSGADSHIIGNIRNTASGIKQLLENDPSCLDENIVNHLISNTERAISDFYKQKYSKKPN